jgi:signal transduction histidine kinase
MRERILDLGGTLDIHSAVGQGTQLVITLPMVTREVNHA